MVLTMTQHAELIWINFNFLDRLDEGGYLDKDLNLIDGVDLEDFYLNTGINSKEDLLNIIEFCKKVIQNQKKLIKHTTMTQKVITGGTSSALNQKIEEHIEAGWKPLGSHQVVETYRQNKFSGQQFMSTQISVEYSQTMIKE